MRIRDAMTNHPHSIGANQTLSKAAKMMQQYNIRHLPVLTGGHLVGMLTQRDLYFVETFREVDTNKVTVDEAMNHDVYCVTPDASLNSVCQHMHENKLGSAVVMEGEQVTGIFTVTDALRLLHENKLTPIV